MTEAATPPLAVATVEAVENPTFDEAMESEIRRILKRYPDHGAALLPRSRAPLRRSHLAPPRLPP